MGMYDTYKWGELDAPAIDQKNALDYWRRTQLNRIQADYDTGKGENDAAMTQAAQAYADNLRNVDNNTAARGVFKSGIRVNDQLRAAADNETQVGAIQRALQRLATQRQLDTDSVDSDALNQASGINTAAAARLYKPPVGALAPSAPAAPAATSIPVPAYKAASPLGNQQNASVFKNIDNRVKPKPSPSGGAIRKLF